MQTPSDGPARDVAIATVTCEYSCGNPTCKAQHVPVDVVARDPDEDVRRFMERLEISVAASHARIAPDCAWRTCDIKIPHPVPGAPLGSPTRQ